MCMCSSICRLRVGRLIQRPRPGHGPRQLSTHGLLFALKGPVVDKHSTNRELEALRCKIATGRELKSKCAKVACWNILKQNDYSSRLQQQVKAIQDCRVTAILSGVLELNSDLPGGGEVAGISSVAALPPPPGKVFGIEKPLTELKGMIRRNQVVGVYGMVGCGKTTLVNVLCRNPDLEGLFHKIFYFRVSKSPDTLAILKTIWSLLLVGEVPTFKDVEDAVRQVAHGLSEQPIKYSGDVLIVLDDVWSKKDLKNLLFRTEHPTRSNPNGLPDRRLHFSPAKRQAGDGVPPAGHPTPWVAISGYCQRRRTSAATMAGRRPPETGRFWPVSPISRSAPFPIFGRLKTAASVPPATLGGRGREARRRPATGNASGGGDAQVDSGIRPSRSTALPLVACPVSPFFYRLQRQTQGSNLCRWLVAGGRRLNGQKPPAHPATNA
ncbi:DA1-related 5 protein [Nymphaea thermarum]|nr:DA1-related 5 protein [Nymphaea thermarum]